MSSAWCLWPAVFLAVVVGRETPAILRVGFLDNYYMRPTEVDALIRRPDPAHKDEPLFTDLIKKVNFRPQNFETETAADELVESPQKVAINRTLTDKLHGAGIRAFLHLDEMTTTVALMLNESNYGRSSSHRFIAQLVRFTKATGFDGVHLNILAYHVNTQDRLDSFLDFVKTLADNHLKFSFGISANPAQDPVKNPCWSKAIADVVNKAEFVVLLDPQEYKLDSGVFSDDLSGTRPHPLQDGDKLVTTSLFLHGLQEYQRRGVDIAKFVLYASHTVVLENGGKYYALSQHQYCEALKRMHAEQPTMSSRHLAETVEIPYLHYATGQRVEHLKDKKQKIVHNALNKLDIGSKALVGDAVVVGRVHGIAVLIDGDFRCKGMDPLLKSALLFHKCMTVRPK